MTKEKKELLGGKLVIEGFDYFPKLKEKFEDKIEESLSSTKEPGMADFYLSEIEDNGNNHMVAFSFSQLKKD